MIHILSTLEKYYLADTGVANLRKSGGIDMNGDYDSSEERKAREDGRGAHLHLQMYLSSDLDEDVFVSKHKLQTSTAEQSIPLDNMEIVNPFNYMETYKNEK